METESNLDGTEMPNAGGNAELEEYFSNDSNDSELFLGSLNEDELCAAYGYEQAKSPTETVMPEDYDNSWLIDEVSQTQNILTGTEQFDLLETDLFGSQDPNCSVGESSNLNCTIKQESQMDQNDHCQCEDENIYLNLDTIDKEESRAYPSLSVDPSHSTICSSHASKESPTEQSLHETTESVRALTRRMTLSQRMKFYAWFNSGLSIAEAAEKSRTPDLIPPPIRHPSCMFSKRRLKSLSKLLPNVFLQRQFVYETYFAGVDPKKIMRSLLIELNSEDLIPTFENQFRIEELAVEDKKRRRAVTAPVESSSGEKANLESTVGCSREEEANLESLDPMLPLDTTLATSEGPRGVEANMESLVTTVGSSRGDEASLEFLDQAKVNVVSLEGDQLMKYCYWRNQGLPTAEAVSKATEYGLAEYMSPHPSCSYSWGEILQASHSLSDSRAKERFLIDVFYNGKEPGQVLFFLNAGNGDIQPGDSRAEDLDRAERQSLLGNFGPFPINNSQKEPRVPSKNRETSTIVSSCRWESIPERDENVEPELHREPSPGINIHVNDQVHVDDGEGILPVEVATELPKMSLTRQTKLYKWCNQGLSPSEALEGSKVPGLIPNSLPHPSDKYSWEETKKMSALLPKNFKKIFNAEVFYGGKEPEEVVKTLMPDNGNPSNSSNTNVDRVLGAPEKAAGDSSEEQHSTPSKNGLLLSATGPAGLLNMSLNQRKKYYKWCNQGVSPSEALVKSKVRRLSPKNIPHPNNKYTWDEVKMMSAGLHHKLKTIFQTEVFYGGKEPEEVIKTLTDDFDLLRSFDANLRLVSGPHGKSQPSAQSKNSPTLSPIERACQSECIAKYGIVDNREIATGLPKMTCNQLKKYYKWCILGLSHEEALSRAKTRGLLPDFGGPHPACQHSEYELRKMSYRLPTVSARDRFVVHTYQGGKNPYELLETMMSNHSNTSQPETNPKTMKKDEYELSSESMRNMRGNYLIARGLRQEEALSELENPSKKLNKEVDDFVEQAHLKEQQILRVLSQDSLPACEDSLERLSESTNVPLGSPFHPSNILDDKQLVNYYLWISNGCSRDEAMKKAMTPGLPTHHLYRQHHLKSELAFHDVQKMSKLLPTRALAKKFVIETYYGGNDPGETMKYLESSSGSGNRRSELSHTHQDLASNPWYSSNLIKGAASNSILPADVASAPTFNGYMYPGLSSQHQNDGLPPKDVQVVHCPGASSASISSYARPSAPVVPEIQPQQMNNTRMDDIRTASHKSEYQRWEDVPRLCLEPIPENPTLSARTTKSPKVDGSHPELTDGEVKCFIVPTNYPKECLNEPQMDAIESSILEAILEMEEDDVKPSFKDSFRSDGRYGVLCNGEFSVNWLRKYLKQYVPYESASLKLMISEPTFVRASAVFPLCKGDDDKKILKFIGKQNRGLNVSRWTVIRRWDSDENTMMDLDIDDESAEVLQKGTRVSFKLGRAEITIVENCSTSSQNGSYVMDESLSVESSTSPPLPSSPIPSTPPPPPPPEEPKVIDTSLKSLLFGSASKSSHQDDAQEEEPKVIDTSLKSLLFGSASKSSHQDNAQEEEPKVIDTSLKSLLFGSASKSSHQDKAQDDSPVRYSRSPVRHGRKRASSPNGVHRKRPRRRRSSSEDRRRSRSSSLDSIGRSIHKLSKKLCKRRRSRDEYSRDRRSSRSTSRDRIYKKKRWTKHRRRHASRSPIHSGRTLDRTGSSEKSRHPAGSMSPISSESNFSIDGGSVESVNGKCSDKSRHPKTPISIISSKSDSFTSACSPVDSRLVRASSCENTEYVDYLR